MEASESTMDNGQQNLMVQTGERIISGFWRRLFAFILDSIFLGIAGLIIGTVFFSFFSALGAWGDYSDLLLPCCILAYVTAASPTVRHLANEF